MQADCIFCNIAQGKIPANLVYEDEHVVAFHDISPAAPVHVLVIPKKHIANLLEVSIEDCQFVTQLMTKIPLIAEQLGLAEKGFRTVINTKDDGGQTVHHLHVHILGGRFMTWPPG
ncbi:Purine nucleoside phosphoramidase [bioreactor metagenome]|jgi:histidine triad (HIT) family protein|uniref:Purine nucleoside phosphoramidase n=1 Tax=bioreactor metagenome TaxID=1076179 RepID=A0A645FRG0_9ZZZZ